MSKRYYRALVLGAIVIWVQVGMYLSAVLAAVDTGLSPSRLDLIMLCAWLVMGVFDAAVLLRASRPPEGVETAAARAA